jgi:hypothetical protein
MFIWFCNRNNIFYVFILIRDIHLEPSKFFVIFLLNNNARQNDEELK